MVAKTRRPEVMAGLGGFGGLFALPPGRYQEPVLVSGPDGVGTKLKLAQLTNRHDTIGIDLVAMCVNDVLVQGAEPLFFLDYFACGRLDTDMATAVISGIADGCEQAGAALIGGETAEMPDMYADGEYDLAGFCVGAIERSQLIDGSTISTGDSIIGIASSGPHSNGYSLIRKVLEQSVDEPSMQMGETTLGEALLAPTRIYVKTLLPIIDEFPVDGLAHITGGGISENIIRVVPEGLGLEIDLSAWRFPPVFRWLQKNGRIEQAEMLRTFNCGIGMAILVAEDAAGPVSEALASTGEPVYRIGRVIDAPDASERVRFIES